MTFVDHIADVSAVILAAEAVSLIAAFVLLSTIDDVVFIAAVVLVVVFNAAVVGIGVFNAVVAISSRFSHE